MSKHSSLVLCLRNTHKAIAKQEALLVCDKPSAKNDLKPGWRWGLPGGKCCDDKLKVRNCCSETTKETAIREAQEETGYEIRVEQIFADELVHPESREKFMRYLFLGKIIGGEQLTIKLPPGLISPVSPNWFPFGNFPKNSHWSHQKIIKRYFGF